MLSFSYSTSTTSAVKRSSQYLRVTHAHHTHSENIAISVFSTMLAFVTSFAVHSMKMFSRLHVHLAVATPQPKLVRSTFR